MWASVRKHLLDPKDEQAASDELRVISRWWLEFARNVITVAGLQLLAEATDNWLLRAVAFAAYSALFVYCFSYVRWWVIPNVFPSIKNQNVRVMNSARNFGMYCRCRISSHRCGSEKRH